MKWQIPANERYDDDNEWINGIRLTSETRGMLIAWSMGVASLMGVAGAVLLKDQWRHDVFLADDEWRVHHFISRRLSDIPAGREGGGGEGGGESRPLNLDPAISSWIWPVIFFVMTTVSSVAGERSFGVEAIATWHWKKKKSIFTIQSDNKDSRITK